MGLEFDYANVRNGVRACAKAKLRVFGSDSHLFELNPPLSLERIVGFERGHGIRLPADYRSFLLKVGNGGAGPFYGLFPLGFMDGSSGLTVTAWHERDGLVGSLKEPFPHDGPWNDTVGLPSAELAERDPAKYERLMGEFDQRYWNSSLVDGAIPICHMGCALRVWLVVSGGEMGNLWRDGRSELSGLQPLVLRDGRRATLGSWYIEWLNGCLQMLSQT